ncbi:hypothetical protein CDAR_372541 [Caerostris darwini]|uniref:Uncharacterized protein n=1 Tax=Caerostris darwini TaxID=1538125 RepID=A0AAV4TB17_9ARAC|nr:hypothetical protein CDAR_372541 [Caerostris darwini]
MLHWISNNNNLPNNNDQFVRIHAHCCPAVVRVEEQSVGLPGPELHGQSSVQSREPPGELREGQGRAIEDERETQAGPQVVQHENAKDQRCDRAAAVHFGCG